jgi:hypothetical protein
MNPGERQNTVVCCFDPSAYCVHKWLYEVLHLPEDDVRTLQIDGPQKKVFIKFTTYDKMMSLFQQITGPIEYKHEDGTLSMVNIELAGIGLKKVHTNANMGSNRARRNLDKWNY